MRLVHDNRQNSPIKLKHGHHVTLTTMHGDARFPKEQLPCMLTTIQCSCPHILGFLGILGANPHAHPTHIHVRFFSSNPLVSVNDERERERRDFRGSYEVSLLVISVELRSMICMGFMWEMSMGHWPKKHWK